MYYCVHCSPGSVAAVCILVSIVGLAYAASAKAPNVYPTIAEDIAYFTWARHCFHMAAPDSDLALRFYAYQYHENELPVEIVINGHSMSYLSDEGHGSFMWHECQVPRQFFVDGVNEIVFRSDNRSTNTWALGIEYAEQPQGSSKSCDRGMSWYRRNLGYNFSVVGQYALRLLDAEGKPITVQPAAEETKAAASPVVTSAVEDLSRRGEGGPVESVRLHLGDLAEDDILQLRFGTTSEPEKGDATSQINSWTPWRTVQVSDASVIVTPVSFPYLQWRILHRGPRSGPDPRVHISASHADEVQAEGRWEELEFSRTLAGEELLECPRDKHIEMDGEAGGARLRRGELVKDEDGNAQFNIDRSAFEPSDTLQATYYTGEQVTDKVWIRKDLVLTSAETEKAYLMLFYELWAHSPRKGGYLYVEPGSAEPLIVSINGTELPPIAPDLEWRERSDDWRLVEFPAKLLQPGLNEVELHTAQGGDWRFAYENSLGPNRSARSTDGGRTWDYNRLGENANDNGEYLIRFWLDRYHEQGMVWSPPLALCPASDKGLSRDVQDLTVEITPGAHVPAGTKVSTQVRFGADLMPDDSTWTDWGTPCDGKPLSVRVPGQSYRYMQWRVVLSTTSRLATPVLDSVEVHVEGRQRVVAGEDAIEVTTLTNPPLRLSSYPPQYNSYNNEMLQKLREWYDLDEVVKDGKSELEKLLLLSTWVYDRVHQAPLRSGKQQQAYGIDERTTHWLPNNALWELDMIRRGYGHLERHGGRHCHQYAHIFVGCCQALGYMARPLLMTRMFPPSGGHCFPEVWSNEYDKWVLIDPTSNVCYIRDDGVPMNTREIRAAQFDESLYKTISLVPCQVYATQLRKGETGVPEGAQSCPKGYEAFSIWLRNNSMDEPAPYPIWDGVHSFRWDGRLWYQDPRVRFFPEFSYNTSRWDDMYWGINECFIQSQYLTPGTVRVVLSHNVPYFSHYEVTTDKGSSATEHTGNFTWQLHNGENTLEVEAVSLHGVRGPASSLKITSKG